VGAFAPPNRHRFNVPHSSQLHPSPDDCSTHAVLTTNPDRLTWQTAHFSRPCPAHRQSPCDTPPSRSSVSPVSAAACSQLLSLEQISKAVPCASSRLSRLAACVCAGAAPRACAAGGGLLSAAAAAVSDDLPSQDHTPPTCKLSSCFRPCSSGASQSSGSEAAAEQSTCCRSGKRRGSQAAAARRLGCVQRMCRRLTPQNWLLGLLLLVSAMIKLRSARDVDAQRTMAPASPS